MTENKDIYLALGTLTAEVKALHEDNTAYAARLDAYHTDNLYRLEAAIARIYALEHKTKVVAQALEEDVRPIIKKVTVWEQRGVGVLATVGMVGTGFGFLLAHFWQPLMALLFPKGS